MINYMQSSDNNSNFDYYAGKNGFYKQQPHAVRSVGLDDYADLTQLDSILSSAKSVLEVGAGTGRVIHYLLNKQFPGEITAIERSPLLFSKLIECFSQTSINLIQADIKTVCLTKKFEVILWLWAGILDFSTTEQAMMIKRLAGFLSAGGYLVIDSLPIQSINAIHTYKNKVILATEQNLSYCGHVIAKNKINQFARQAGLIIDKHTAYHTKTGRERLLSFLKKK